MIKDIENRLEPLVDCLRDLRDLHEQLLLAVHGKQRAMRSGDMNSLESWSARERFLIERIESADRLRREHSESLATVLGLEPSPTLAALADRLEEPGRSRLLALAGAIRGVADRIYQANRVNDAVTREILNCFAQMHRQITATHCDLGLYDPNGHKQMGHPLNILDAVG